MTEIDLFDKSFLVEGGLFLFQVYDALFARDDTSKNGIWKKKN